MPPSADASPHRPLRRDAERNRLRILAAAREIFAARGVDVTLDDIAAHAGVGVGTVYRRYPSREHLVEALFDEALGQLLGHAQRAIEHPDPWAGLTDFLAQAIQLMSDRGLRDVLFSRAYGHGQVARMRERIAPAIEALVARCQQAGVLRADIVGADLALVQFMTSALLDYTDQVQPGLWRRYLTLILDGLRQQISTLPEPAPDVDTVDRIAEEWRPPRRPQPDPLTGPPPRSSPG